MKPLAAALRGLIWSWCLLFAVVCDAASRAFLFAGKGAKFTAQTCRIRQLLLYSAVEEKDIVMIGDIDEAAHQKLWDEDPHTFSECSSDFPAGASAEFMMEVLKGTKTEDRVTDSATCTNSGATATGLTLNECPDGILFSKNEKWSSNDSSVTWANGDTLFMYFAADTGYDFISLGAGNVLHGVDLFEALSNLPWVKNSAASKVVVVVDGGVHSGTFMQSKLDTWANKNIAVVAPSGFNTEQNACYCPPRCDRSQKECMATALGMALTTTNTNVGDKWSVLDPTLNGAMIQSLNGLATVQIKPNNADGRAVLAGADFPWAGLKVTANGGPDLANNCKYVKLSMSKYNNDFFHWAHGGDSTADMGNFEGAVGTYVDDQNRWNVLGKTPAETVARGDPTKRYEGLVGGTQMACPTANTEAGCLADPSSIPDANHACYKALVSNVAKCTLLPWNENNAQKSQILANLCKGLTDATAYTTLLANVADTCGPIAVNVEDKEKKTTVYRVKKGSTVRDVIDKYIITNAASVKLERVNTEDETYELLKETALVTHHDTLQIKKESHRQLTLVLAYGGFGMAAVLLLIGAIFDKKPERKRLADDLADDVDQWVQDNSDESLESPMGVGDSKEQEMVGGSPERNPDS